MDLSFLHGKNVLITGGSGFVGRNFVEALLKDAVKIRITLHNQPSPFPQDMVDIVYADLTVAEDCIKACTGMDYVIHAAGSVGNAGSIRSNLVAPMVDNISMSIKLLEAASGQCEKFLIFSSGTTGYPPYDRPVREEDMWTSPPAPVYFGYGWMRRYFELFGEYVNRVSPLQVMLCRPTAIYGRHDNSNHVIPSLIRRALSGENPFVVWGTGDEQRDFLHVSDFVHGCLLLLQKGVGSDPVNIGYGKTTTISEVAKTIMRAAGRSETDIVFDDTRPTTIPVRAVDCTKAKKVLGFIPELSLEAGLNDTFEWYKNQMKFLST
jgi:GDP-L-fucose synthase